MKIQIERIYVEALVAEFPEFYILAEQLKFGNKAEIPVHHFSELHLGFLHNLYQQAGSAMQGKAAQIATLRHALMDGGKRFKEGDLELLVPAIAEFLISDAVRGWLFKINAAGRPLAYFCLLYTSDAADE